MNKPRPTLEGFDYVHAISPLPRCGRCGTTMTNRGNLSMHTLALECPNCRACITAEITFVDGHYEPDIESIDQTP